MFLTVSCRFVPLLDTGLSAGVAIATPASKISPPATSASHVACVDCLLLDNFNFLQEIISFWYKGYKTLI